MPAQERIGCDDRGQPVEGLAAEHFALESQAAELVIVQQDSTLTELFSQYLILSQQILDRVLLVSVDPTGQDEKQELPGLEHEETFGQYCEPQSTATNKCPAYTPIANRQEPLVTLHSRFSLTMVA